MMQRDKRYVMNNPSEFMDIKGSNRNKRVYTQKMERRNKKLIGRGWNAQI